MKFWDGKDRNKTHSKRLIPPVSESFLYRITTCAVCFREAARHILQLIDNQQYKPLNGYKRLHFLF
jgi:hypothetical protein